MDGPNPNPNVANTGGGQIKTNQMEPPRKQSKSNPNQIPAQKTQMGPNGGAREPAIWDLSFCLTTIDAANRSSSTLLSPTHDSGAIRSNILLARLMRRMSVCEFGFVVPCARTKTQFIFCAGNEHVLVGEAIQDHHH